MTDLGLILGGVMQQLLTHSYSRTPVTQGSDDAWYDTSDTAGTTVTGLPCVLVWEDRLVVDDNGRRTLRIPVLYLPADDTLAVGDRVSSVTDAGGTVQAAGPLTVQSIDPAMGLGSSAMKIAVLRGATVAE